MNVRVAMDSFKGSFTPLKSAVIVMAEAQRTTAARPGAFSH